jgi:hypothetical protein
MGAAIALNGLGIWRNYRLRQQMLKDAAQLETMLARVTQMQDNLLQMVEARGVVYIQPDPEMRQ